MALLRVRRLAIGRLLVARVPGPLPAAVDLVIYTVPSSARAVVRFWSVSATVTPVSSANCVLIVQPVGQSARWADSLPPPAYGKTNVRPEVQLVLEPGDKLTLRSSNTVDYYVAGAELPITPG